MHIEDKLSAIGKAAALLNNGRCFVLSIDKNREPFIDMGTRKVRIFPDSPEEISACIGAAGLQLTEQAETEFAQLFVALKG